MNFNIQSRAFHAAASAVSKVINSKNALQILNNLHITVKDDVMVIIGSDSENALMAKVEVSDCEGETSICLEAKRLVDFLKDLPDTALAIKVDDDSLAVELTYPGGEYHMVGINGNEYPQYRRDDEGEDTISFGCPADVLIAGIENTIFAVGDEEFRPQMMGIYFDIKEDNITFVATDTRKLVRYTDRSVRPGVVTSCIVGAKPASILKTVFGKEDELTVTMTSKGATIAGERFIFNCRFIKGNFPPYDRVIPKDNPFTLTVDRQRLISVMRRLSNFVDGGNGLVRFRLSAERIEFEARDQQMCTNGRESLPCSYEGNDLTICFSANYVLDICNVIPTEEVVVKLSDPARPGVFIPSENAENTDLLMLLMPMSLVDF